MPLPFRPLRNHLSRGAVAALAVLLAVVIRADNSAQPLPFAQAWSTTSALNVTDDWSGVPGITGYRGDDLTTATGTDPQTILADGTSTPVDVNVNQTNPNTNTTGGVTEFEIADPVVALQGSGTADAPFLLITLNTTGRYGIDVAYNVRDIDGSADDAVQQVALHYRVGSSGAFTNIPAGYIADATLGGSATKVTPVAVTLPAAANNQPVVQLRIMTTNAVGNDEWVGIDDIVVSGGDTPPVSTNPTASASAAPSTVLPGQTSLLTVAVTPGTNPASTGIVVTGDLSSIGGSAAQAFVDDGTGGDASAGDMIFSYLATVASGTAPGAKTLTMSVTDTQSRSVAPPPSTGLLVQAVPASPIVPLPYTQNWSDTSMITVADSWTNVPGIVGYLGQNITTGTGVDPRTLLTMSTVANDIDVIPNQTNPSITNGGVAEFDGIANPVVALQGSGTADAPFLLISIDTTGQSNIRVRYNVRDIDGTADDAVQQVALQYRIGDTGDFTNLPGGYIADATEPNAATLVTPVDVFLPPAVDNLPLVQLRIITTNAVGNDEWVGIDDINIASSTDITSPTATASISPGAGWPGDLVLLTASVTSGQNPTSTGLVITADLTALGGSATQSLLDDGTNGDVTAGDHVYSYRFNSAVNTTTGPKVVPVSLLDDQGRTGSATAAYLVQTPTAITSIHDIQGPGSASPLAGQTVTTTGIVIGVKSNGFFIQTPDEDADPNTSEGLQVFGSPVPATAAVGNLVRVTGIVAEFIPAADPGSPPLTELTGSTVAVLAAGQPLPAPKVLGTADINETTGAEPLERFEGMRVQIASVVVIAPTGGFVTEPTASSESNGVFHAVMPGVPRPFREPGINAGNPVPDDTGAGVPPNVPQFDTNPERLRIESRGLGGAAVDVATGAIVSGLVGVVDFRFRAYTILTEPGAPLSVDGTWAAIPVRASRADEFTVGSFNMQRFFDTTDDLTPVPSGGTVADPVLTPDAFEKRLNKASLAIRDVMRSPDILGVEEMENLSTLQILAARVNADAAAAGQALSYLAFLAEGNDIGGIDVGFLVNANRVNVIDVVQLGKDTTYIDPNTGSPALLNDRPPLVMRAEAVVPGYSPYPVTVIVNHLRSLNDVETEKRVRLKRRLQAEFLANLIQSRQAAGERVISVGDYNAFQFNDGYVDSIGTIKGAPTPADQVAQASADLVEPNLIDLIDLVPADQRYSYTFDGNAQEIDHILVTSNLTPSIDYARANADFPDILRNDANRPERLSDHDMVVGYFTLNSAPSCTAAAPTTSLLWPSDNRMVTIGIAGITDADGEIPAVTITGVFQDELTNNENNPLTSVDAILAGGSVQLRAQRGTPRVVGNGRVYHVSFSAADAAGASCTGEVLVTVPPTQTGTAVDGGALYDSTIPRVN